MLISEVMTREVESIGPDDSLQQAARMMRQFRVGTLPVVENQSVVGVVTDRDIILRAVAQGLDPAKTAVSAAMSEEVVCCFEDQEIEVAANLMQSKQIRRILVLDRDKKLVGIIARPTWRRKLSIAQRAGEILQEVSGAAPQA